MRDLHLLAEGRNGWRRTATVRGPAACAASSALRTVDGEPLRRFWELEAGEHRPEGGLPFDALCCLLYESALDRADPVLAIVYRHREEEGYPVLYQTDPAFLPRPIRDFVVRCGRLPTPEEVPAPWRPVWASVSPPIAARKHA